MRKKISQERLRALIQAEAAKLPGCTSVRDIRFFGTEQPELGNWTVAFAGVAPGHAAAHETRVETRL